MITVDQIWAKHPCARYNRNKVEEVIGAGVTVQDIKTRTDVPPEDRLWALLVFEMTDQQRGLFACDCADQALSLLDSPDSRSVSAITTVRQYLASTATKSDLVTARIGSNAAGFLPAFAAVDAVLSNTRGNVLTVANAAVNAGVTWEWQLTRALTIIGAL